MPVLADVTTIREQFEVFQLLAQFTSKSYFLTERGVRLSENRGSSKNNLNARHNPDQRTFIETEILKLLFITI